MNARIKRANSRAKTIKITTPFIQDVTAECALCLDTMEETDRRVLPCGHIFHTACMKRMIEHNFVSCPMCRKPFTQQSSRPTFDASNRTFGNIPLSQQ